MNNQQPKTVKLFLVDGDPTGIKKVQLSNWSGIAFVIPRSRIEFVNKREEFSKQCLYFLLSGNSSNPEVYIGEAESFQNRIGGHRNKDFWNICIVFLAKDENLSKAHVKFLEAEFITDCKKANRAKLYNGNEPEGSKLSEEDNYEMLEFKNNIKTILSTLGYTFHENATAQDKTYDKYFINTKGLEAKGIYTPEGMIVLEGSQVAKNEVRSIHEYLKNLRMEKLEDKTMEDKGDYYEVLQRITFSSVSTAAGFVKGSAANGWREWKNSNGKTIDEVERRSLEDK